ncbi:vesicular glutamate transporter 1, partial [Plakobranchus ocellatus]
MIGFSEITSERSQSYSFEQLRKMKEIEKAPLFFSQRLLLATMAFLGKAIVYASRYNLSIAIVCMVRGQMDNSSASGISDALQWSNVTVSANSSMPEPGACGGRDDEDTNAKSNENAEFDWDRTTTSNLLAMYFYGYLFLQIPGGWLASRYGGKRVWGVCQAVSAVCTLLTPVCARTSVYLTCALRFILGFVAAVTFPCVHALLGQWSPPVERSKMVGCTFSGAVVGNVVTFALSGLLCAYGFDNGWGSIFYLTGVLNLVWVVAWFWLVADSPGKHKHISEKEQVYITASIGKGLVKDVTGAPWLAILQSGPVWAIVIAQVCSNYILETQSILLPTYMKESLNFDIKA